MHGVVLTGDSGLKKKKKKKASTRLVKKEQNDREIHNGVDEQYSRLTIVKILRVS